MSFKLYGELPKDLPAPVKVLMSILHLNGFNELYNNLIDGKIVMFIKKGKMYIQDTEGD